MLERFLILLALVVFAVVVVQVVRALARRRAQASVGQMAPDRLRSRLPAKGPAFVYFYGPNCATCADQALVLDALARAERIPVLSVDTASEQELADALGALTIPTTALVDAAGRVRQVNLGYHPRHVLERQLAAI